MYTLRSAVSIVVVCVATLTGCVGDAGRAPIQVQDFCTFENRIDDVLNSALSTSAVMLMSRHIIVVSSARCPRFGMSYVLARGSTEADNATLDALNKTIDRAYDNSGRTRSG